MDIRQINKLANEIIRGYISDDEFCWAWETETGWTLAHEYNWLFKAMPFSFPDEFYDWETQSGLTVLEAGRRDTEPRRIKEARGALDLTE
jgi:hypothetical protein